MIYVATVSPRRIDLLDKLDFDYKLITPCKEEINLKSLENLAIQKALSKVQCLNIDDLVVAFDTVVMLKDRVFEKPKSFKQAKSMLQSLSGNWHVVISAFAIKSKNVTKAYYEKTYVKFSKLDKNDIDFLISKENVFDKAGAYAIQGYAALYIEKIIGDYYNVVGFPLCKFKNTIINDFNLSKSTIFKTT